MTYDDIKWSARRHGIFLRMGRISRGAKYQFRRRGQVIFLCDRFDVAEAFMDGYVMGRERGRSTHTGKDGNP